MWFVFIGLALIVMNILGVGPVADWTWNLTGDLWKFTVPFICAAMWWAWADKSGLNKRREIEKIEAKKRNRRQENLDALGLDARSRRKR